jgi:hypothetical protein
LLLNNCTDASFDICNGFAAHRAGVEIHEVTLHGALATAGEARRLALHFAALPQDDSVILTTDADSVPERSWIEKNLREMEAGADVVCGMADIDPADAASIPGALHEDDARETFLLSLLDEITSLLNPIDFDPWPRHQQQSGASIAMRREALQRAGGPPHVKCCEDRVLIEKLRLVDARIRHAPGIRVKVSGRLEGRAAGGMAETLRRRMRSQDILTDEKLEPAVDAFRRAVAQSRLRQLRQGNEDLAALARDLLICPTDMQRFLQLEFYGQAWAAVQATSPGLHRRRVAFADVLRETRIALGLRETLLRESTAVQRDALDMRYA